MTKERETVRALARDAYARAKELPLYSAGWQYWTSQAHAFERLLVPGATIFVQRKPEAHAHA